MEPIIEFLGAGRTFSTAGQQTQALRPTWLSIARGEYIAVTGPSGSGKSTLLNLICGIDRATVGAIRVDGYDVSSADESALSRFRGAHIGIVFQFFELLATLTAQENILLAMDLVGRIPGRDRRRRALALLAEVGLAEHARKLPAQLSGGEQQRVAIARALANDAPILLADEPTGNLDSVNGERVAQIFAQCAAQGRTVVIATHERSGLDKYHRIVRLQDGALLEPTPRPS